MDMDKLLPGHEVDGIREYDNPPPAWLVWLFNLSILFSIGYCIVYPSTWFWNGTMGWSQTGQYDRQMVAAQERYGTPAEAAPADVDLVALAQDPTALAAGEEIFKVRCAACHGASGEGGPIAPSLVDDEWLYGNAPDDIIASISGGRPNGMPTWGKVLSSTEVAEVAAFVTKLKGED